MFDQEKLVAVIAAYKDYFPNHWKDEKYKWEAIQYFQEHWNISAENFLDMFMEATDKTYNLLAFWRSFQRVPWHTNTIFTIHTFLLVLFALQSIKLPEFTKYISAYPSNRHSSLSSELLTHKDLSSFQKFP